MKIKLDENMPLRAKDDGRRAGLAGAPTLHPPLDRPPHGIKVTLIACSPAVARSKAAWYEASGN